ncbi:hypothetical protein PR048_021608 [Dryococelus australis]|uniref:Uncharacterized protein n=1 Tax=Dryococelus australis TaxID=614101 RepID=A0ABQ9GYN8_9NEOP|nr:hypothetical protein PR048_021608 [Dryococelus australis]
MKNLRKKILPKENMMKSSDILQQICCDIHNENCLLRKSENCKSNEINFRDFKENYIGVYLKWQTSKETYRDKNGNQKTFQKMNKDVIMVNLLEMGDLLQNSVNENAAHVGRVIHQHEALKYQKENLQFNVAVIHMDLISLHTVVTYLHDKNFQLDMPYTIQSFCTLSDCLDHGVHAIWAHLKPILKTLSGS